MKRVAVLLAALLLAGCGGSDDEQASGDKAAAEPQLADLTSVAELKRRFNADEGVPRLIVLVAPT